MNLTPIILRHGNSELFAIPAIHFNHVFASSVNAICFDPETKPDAIAVELGPCAAAGAEKWLRELYDRPNGLRRLPVMLGLMKKNRLIKNSLKEKALQLQKETGRDLSELPSETLRRELGFTGNSLLCLSPTDSIIEAIRCGVELDIPVFGIDLDDMADGIYRPVMVQDPGKEESLTAYIDRNASFAECQRDNEIDHRREVVMAARLKALMENYRRVLFTCGMAHWLRLRDILNDTSVKPSLMPEKAEKADGEFRRVIVHPQMAVRYMDSYPIVSTVYERRRLSKSNSSHSVGKRSYPDIAKISDALLKKSYRKYFKADAAIPRNNRRGEDLGKVRDFEDYLNNLCFLSHRPAPDIFMTIRSAQETMSSEFARVLSDTFMKFPWASPDTFPDIPLLIPSSSEPGAIILMKDGHQDGEVFHVRTAEGRRSVPNIPYEWKEAKEYLKKLKHGFMSHSWRPWDYLISALSFKAIEAAAKKQITKKAVAFEGNLLEGLDIKSTIRSYSRGSERFYVRDLCKENLDSLNPLEKFPVVWLFDPGNDNSAEWITLHEPCRYMERYVRDRTFFEHVTNEHGHNMVATIAYGNRHINDNGLSENSQVHFDRYYGVILFQPIYFTNKQFARYAEMTGYHRRSPFCNDTSLNYELSDLASYYAGRHGIRVGEFHWATTLILLALPFAKDVLVVTVPEGYKIEQVVYRKAKKYGIEICPLPHTIFSRAQLDRISFSHLVPAISMDLECIYSKEVEEEIGELQTENRHLIPQRLLDFGNM